MRLCEPCAYLGSLIGPEVIKAMAHKAGISARIHVGGEVRPGLLVNASAT
jgi:MOSC domain-containing protein YiiM